MAYSDDMDNERLWLLLARKFSKEATVEELSELEALLERNAGLQYAYQLIGELKETGHDDQKILQNALEKVDLSMRKENSAMESRKRSLFKWRKIWGAAAAIALLIAATSGYYVLHHKQETGHHKLALSKDNGRIYVAAHASSIILQDGTKVWLNSGSTLRCSDGFNIHKRTVLLEGEAFFDVARNASRPFIVQAGNMEVKVLGTRFNVKAYPGDPFIEASLISGKIAVDLSNKAGREVILKPHEKLTIDTRDTATAGRRVTKSRPAILNYQVRPIKLNPIDSTVSELSWMKDKLAFNDITFEELAYDLQRIYHVKIRFGKESLKKYHLTGVFKDEDLSEVLHALQVTTPFQYAISQDLVNIY
jgi:ferric-dicitrate binding protein FerR (iron transport regulator)